MLNTHTYHPDWYHIHFFTHGNYRINCTCVYLYHMYVVHVFMFMYVCVHTPVCYTVCVVPVYRTTHGTCI